MACHPPLLLDCDRALALVGYTNCAGESGQLETLRAAAARNRDSQSKVVWLRLRSQHS